MDPFYNAIPLLYAMPRPAVVPMRKTRLEMLKTGSRDSLKFLRFSDMRLSVLRYVFFRVLHNALTASVIAFFRMTGDNVPFCRRASSAPPKSLFRDVEEPFLRPGTASSAPSVRSYGLRNGLFRASAMPVSVRRMRLSRYRTSENDVLNKCRVFVNKCLCEACPYVLAR